MDERKKLKVVIEHWIEHNEGHAGEYKKWAEKAGGMGLERTRDEIEEAVGKLSLVNHHLKEALRAITAFYA
jgi:hypothetical protein